MSGLSKYKRKVSDMLPCTKEERKYVLAEIDQSLGKEAETMSYEAIVEKIGIPEEVAAASIQGMEPRNIAAAMQKRRDLIRFAAILVVGLLLIWTVGVTVAVIDSMQHSGGHAIISTAEIIESWTIP